MVFERNLSDSFRLHTTPGLKEMFYGMIPNDDF